MQLVLSKSPENAAPYIVLLYTGSYKRMHGVRVASQVILRGRHPHPCSCLLLTNVNVNVNVN